jgi:hypothetical protein
MRILGLAGLVLALAIMGYLILGYLGEAGRVHDTLGAIQAPRPGQPGDLTRRGLEQRLSPVLDQERKRVEETSRAANQ